MFIYTGIGHGVTYCVFHAALSHRTSRRERVHHRIARQKIKQEKASMHFYVKLFGRRMVLEAEDAAVNKMERQKERYPINQLRVTPSRNCLLGFAFLSIPRCL